MSDWCKCDNVTRAYRIEGNNRYAIQCPRCKKHKDYCPCHGCEGIPRPIGVWNRTIKKHLDNGLAFRAALWAAKEELYPHGLKQK